MVESTAYPSETALTSQPSSSSISTNMLLRHEVVFRDQDPGSIKLAMQAS